MPTREYIASHPATVWHDPDKTSTKESITASIKQATKTGQPVELRMGNSLDVIIDSHSTVAGTLKTLEAAEAVKGPGGKGYVESTRIIQSTPESQRLAQAKVAYGQQELNILMKALPKALKNPKRAAAWMGQFAEVSFELKGKSNVDIADVAKAFNDAGFDKSMANSRGFTVSAKNIVGMGLSDMAEGRLPRVDLAAYAPGAAGMSASDWLTSETDNIRSRDGASQPASRQGGRAGVSPSPDMKAALASVDRKIGTSPSVQLTDSEVAKGFKSNVATARPRDSNFR